MRQFSLKRWRGGMPRLATSLLVSVIAAGGLLAATGTPRATAGTVPGARPSAIASSSPSLYWDSVAISVIPHTHTAWMTGDKSTARSTAGTLWWSDGGAWSAVKSLPVSPNEGFGDVSALSPKDVWVEETLPSGKAAFLVFNGSSWRTVPINLPASLNGYFIDSSLVLSADDIWATASGACGKSGCTEVLLHSDGKTWSEPTIPGLGRATVVQLAGSSPNNLWLLTGTCSALTGACSSPSALRFDGKWARFAVPGQMTEYQAGLAVSSPSDVWLEDTTDVARFNGSHLIVQRGWSKTYSTRASLGIAPFGPASAWVTSGVASHPLMKFNGVSGTPVAFSLPGHSPAFSLVAAASPQSAWVVGGAWTGQVCNSSYLPVAFHFNGTKWLRIGLPLTGWPLATTRTTLTPEC